ncbi:hypothetical protein GCM10022229_26550 [Luteimonas lutimaris]|uniref:Spore protein YkvP/CgeB glycosyl transferase-like domain-containing protein n=1 Tax=Luteimonas lutimaris TaxID=698645 RepID=A0ABP7N026_9GAMM
MLAKLDEQLRYRRRINAILERERRKSREASKDAEVLRNSFSFRLGSLLLGAARSPKRMLMLPHDGFALLREAWPRISNRLRRGARQTPSDSQPDLGPDVALAGKDADWMTESVIVAEPIQRLSPGTEAAPLLPDNLATLRIATVMDEFSFNAFSHCGDLLQIGAEDWRREIEEFEPNLLLVESAWKGRDESWARKVYPLSREMVDMVAWCRERRIPTVFWNKEDPVHLSVFMRTARQFDFVFTTDIDCVRAYKAALGHEQVYWLPFACQPAEHNPIEEYQRKDGFCFAGSFYAKYPERQRDFATIIDSMSRLRPVDIYDRNAGKDDPALAFPDVYDPMIQGSLPYTQISLAYKGYRYGININTVKQSQSMFARRAFDLLASNTVTVSNFSRGLRMLLGDLVIASDDGTQLAARVRPLLGDDSTYRRFRLAGLRKVMSEHTYQDRLRYVLEKVGGRAVDDGLPHVVVVGHASDADQVARLCVAFERQRHPSRELVLVVPAGLDVQERVGLTVVTEADAANVGLAACWPEAWVACFDPEDHHGEHYLTDLVLATRYAGAGPIGKAARFTFDGQRVSLRDEGMAYRTGQSIPLRRAIVRAAESPVADLLSMARRGADVVVHDACAIDEFHYCEKGAGIDATLVGDLAGLWAGVSLQRLHRLAETATAADVLAAEQISSPAMDAAELAQILPCGDQHADGRVSLALREGRLLLRSKLAGDLHAYLYAPRPLPVAQLFPGGIGKFNLVVDTEMLVSFVFIFLDAKRERIGHAIRACSSNLSISAPAGTCHVRLGLRVQGPGEATVRRLVLGHVPSPAAGIPARAEHLVVSRGYPAYDNLYSYAYVHRRIKGYAAAGVPVDVFRINEDHVRFSEFEDIDVVSGQLSDLELMIRSNPYRTVLVHSLDRALWSTLKECASDREILVWIHGAEIQPWYRRDFSFLDDRDRERGIQRSNDRMAFWRDIFADTPDNTKFIFVSRHLAREAMRDVGVELDPSRYVVIHNHVDGELFKYTPKPAAQRNRLLSIRPYSRPTYANDLVVKAILDLVDEPWFGQLEFRLIGDGRLFDETVEPVRHLPNVVLEKRFLSQSEIAALHREYGVFLAPSRIDSQGVSRDEAMASGLVPVTNRVSAIPEFADASCAMLAEPEDWRGIADAIRRLHAEPDLFLSLSEAAAARVRAQSGAARTLDRELALMLPDRRSADEPLPVPVTAPRTRRRIALYGDLDLNLIDGSAVWAASLARVLAGEDEVDVDLFLKARIRQTQVIRELLGMVNVRLIEPAGDTVRLRPEQALDSIVEADGTRGYDAVVLRGFDLALLAQERAELAGRLWVYLTDIPQHADDFTPERLDALRRVTRGAALVLCQTPALEQHLVAMSPEAAGKTRLLPPMIPDYEQGHVAPARTDGMLRLAYAGKFAPLWGIRELFDAVGRLRAEGVPIELHVFGDKIHNPPDDPGFRPFVEARLQDEGVVWRRGLDRGQVLERLRGMDAGWAWRLPQLEERTLELSTKLLEYAASGAPPVLAPGAVNEGLFGAGYPLFATAQSLADLLRSMARDPEILAQARRQLEGIAARYTFSAVRERHVAPLLLEAARGLAAATSGSAS